jgi:amino acid transporter
MIPIAGSAYTYAYATLGELVAWMIGWDLILEYAVGSMTVAIGWSGYMQRLLAGFGITIPQVIGAAPPAGIINLPAVIIVLFIMILLVVGVAESARFNAVMVAIKLVAVLFFLGAGITYVEPANWQPFAPYGWPGIMAAAAVVFFAYIGFDAVSTTAEEAKNPQRDLPIGIIASLVVCTVLYLAVGLVLSGIVPVIQFRSVAEALPGVAMVDQAESIKFLNAPVAYALAFIPPGLGRGPGLGRRRRGHHLGAARHADEPAAHLLLDEPRPPAPARRQQGSPEVRHAVHHHDHHVRDRRAGRRTDTDSSRR